MNNGCFILGQVQYCAIKKAEKKKAHFYNYFLHTYFFFHSCFFLTKYINIYLHSIMLPASGDQSITGLKVKISKSRPIQTKTLFLKLIS